MSEKLIIITQEEALKRWGKSGYYEVFGELFQLFPDIKEIQMSETSAIEYDMSYSGATDYY